MKLSELRKSRGDTQEQLAADMSTTQGQVSRIERQKDLKLSTIQRYVSALGGRLEVIVTFPGAVIYHIDIETKETSD